VQVFGRKGKAKQWGSKDAERNCPFYVDILGSLAFVVVISVVEGLAVSGPFRYFGFIEKAKLS
jgi:hypothetical protein